MIVMHHLRVGRAIFTTWLLEELGVEYELKLYDRNEMGRAPAELKAAHPLGKSPVIEDGGVTLAESGAITTYLIETYDPDGALSPPLSNTKAIRTKACCAPEVMTIRSGSTCMPRASFRCRATACRSAG